ncbi:MAG: 50S ribosomal protein L24 [Saprospiraceae bacterium]|nr:50S ribosomal protein L24 [Saprospiraceae bacterium]MCB9344575.1 50S ribosomal protein L24 [Lewinellaceae bacterium]
MATKNTSKRFAPKLHIRKGDKVMVISGDYKGRTGEVIEVIPSKNRAVVEGVNIVKKHIKATQNESGGIVEMPASIHISNLSLVDPKSGEPTRINYDVDNNGVKVRISKKSGNVIK